MEIDLPVKIVYEIFGKETLFLVMPGENTINRMQNLISIVLCKDTLNLNILYTMLSNGNGIGKDESEFIRWSKEAADKNCFDPALELARR